MTSRYYVNELKTSYQRRVECYFEKHVLSAVVSGQRHLRPLSKFRDILAEILVTSPILRLRPLSIKTNFSIVVRQISSHNVPFLGARRKFVAVLCELLVRGVPTLRPIYTHKRIIRGMQVPASTKAFQSVMIELKLGLPPLRPVPPIKDPIEEEENGDFVGIVDGDDAVDANGAAVVSDTGMDGMGDMNDIEEASFVTTNKSGRRHRSGSQRSSDPSSVSEDCGSIWIDGRRRSARVCRSRKKQNRPQLGTVMLDGKRRSARLLTHG
jgi:hypothetical protein